MEPSMTDQLPLELTSRRITAFYEMRPKERRAIPRIGNSEPTSRDPGWFESSKIDKNLWHRLIFQNFDRSPSSGESKYINDCWSKGLE